MENCLFCKIINREVPSYVIHENDNFIAFLDISQNSKGHVLALPKEHISSVLDEKYNDLDHANYQLFITEVCNIIEKKLNPNGFNFVSNHGSSAGQMIPHLHTHIVPRYDGISFDMNMGFNPKSEEELQAIFAYFV